MSKPFPSLVLLLEKCTKVYNVLKSRRLMLVRTSELWTLGDCPPDIILMGLGVVSGDRTPEIVGRGSLEMRRGACGLNQVPFAVAPALHR